jgi:hypothetical protein
MGGPLYQQAQLLMKWMQDNLDLVRFPRLPIDSLEENMTELSNPNVINIGNTNGLEGHESIIPPSNSPTSMRYQLETSQVFV